MFVDLHIHSWYSDGTFRGRGIDAYINCDYFIGAVKVKIEQLTLKKLRKRGRKT